MARSGWRRLAAAAVAFVALALGLPAAAGAAAGPHAGRQPASVATAPQPVDLNGVYDVYSGACPPEGKRTQTWSISAFEGSWPEFATNGLAKISIPNDTGTISESASGKAIVNTTGRGFYLQVTATAAQVQLSNNQYCAVNPTPQKLSGLATISGTETKLGKPWGPGVYLNFGAPSYGPFIQSQLASNGTYEFWVPTPPVRYLVSATQLPQGQGTFLASTCAPPNGLLSPTTCDVELLPATPPNHALVNFTWVGGPKLVLQASNPTKVNATGTTSLSLKAQVTPLIANVAGANLKVQLGPKVVVPNATTLTATVGDVALGTTKTVSVTGGQLTPTVIADGHTLGGMNAWATANPANYGWHNQAMPPIQWAGGRLVYSDYPEFLDSNTQVGPTGIATGVNVEGVLYKEGPGTYAAFPGHEDFRLFFKHENRTKVGKQVCVVFQATTAGEKVSIQRQGIVNLDGSDPVRIGRDALVAYYASPPGGTMAISTRVGLQTEPVKAYCPTSGALGTAYGAGSTGIIDYQASGPGSLSVGVVVLNAGQPATDFVLNPLGYHFLTKNKTPYTYATGPDLYNFLEQAGHVAGTFPHDILKTPIEPCNPACAPYDEETGSLWGAVILGDPNKPLPIGAPEDRPEYEQSLDTKKFNIGNYGVQYAMTIPTTGPKGEVDQVLLNDRGLGAAGVNNAFADVVQADGTEIFTPIKGQPGVGNTGNLTDANYGIGVGIVDASSTFSLDLIPAAGSTFPLAIVLAPAYLEMYGTLTYTGGTSYATPNPTFISLIPAASTASALRRCAWGLLLPRRQDPCPPRLATDRRRGRSRSERTRAWLDIRRG
jgi:hypothetical protein